MEHQYFPPAPSYRKYLPTLVQPSSLDGSGQESGSEDGLSLESGSEENPEHMGYLYHPPAPSYQQYLPVVSSQESGADYSGDNEEEEGWSDSSTGRLSSHPSHRESGTEFGNESGSLSGHAAGGKETSGSKEEWDSYLARRSDEGGGFKTLL